MKLLTQHIDGLMQNYGNSSAFAMELPQFLHWDIDMYSSPILMPSNITEFDFTK